MTHPEYAQAAVTALLPAAQFASQLRALGIRLVAEPRAIAALQALATPGQDSNVDVVVGNLFPTSHPEVQGLVGAVRRHC